jgi:hypothetical protein
MDNPYQPIKLSDQQKIQLIDQLRPRGSYEEARKHLTETAVDIAKRISAAIPGQGWSFAQDPNVKEVNDEGTHCDNGLTEDIARRPFSDHIDFDKPFTASQFGTAIDILRQEAAKLGVKTKQGESSLFNETAKRDYQIEGNGYTFRILQINGAGLMLTGPCVLMQKVLDLPPGQLPPE